jgi:hypothetical protein
METTMPLLLMKLGKYSRWLKRKQVSSQDYSKSLKSTMSSYTVKLYQLALTSPQISSIMASTTLRTKRALRSNSYRAFTDSGRLKNTSFTPRIWCELKTTIVENCR